jgi:hypothetical protein
MISGGSMRPIASLLALTLLGCPKEPIDTGTEPPDDIAVEICTWYADEDGDGWGHSFTHQEAPCELAPEGWVAVDGDCDDGDPAINPDADELCNGVDDDCDNRTDEDDALDATTWYPDADGDGYGSDADAAASCNQPAGGLATGGDCDDDEPAVNPDAVEILCDLADNDCDGVADGGLRVPADHATIQSAIDAASTGDTVCVAAGAHQGPVDYRGKGVAVVGVAGVDETYLTVDSGRVVTMASGEPEGARLEGFQVYGGEAELGAGLYLEGATVELVNLRVSYNTCPEGSASCEGTGLTAIGSVLDATNLSVDKNDQFGETNRGAGVWLQDSTVRWEGGGADDNEQGGHYDYGAGIAAQDSEVELLEVNISSNKQFGLGYGGNRYGAGLYHTGGSLVMRDSRFNAQRQSADAGTDARFYGSGISLASTEATLTDVVVEANLQRQSDGDVCYASGAGIYAASSTLVLGGVEITDNSAEVDGTVTYAYGPGLTGSGELVLTATGSRFDGNEVVGASNTQAFGGGLYLRGTWVASLTTSTISGNSIDAGYAYGVGLAAYEYGELALTNVIVAGNQAVDGSTAQGVGLFVYYTDASLSQVDLVGNSCGGGGGSCAGAALYPKYQANLALNGCHIVGNDSGGSGGAGSSYDGSDVSVTLAYSDVWDNGSSPWDNLSTALVVGEGVLAADPLFTDVSATDPTAWDLGLQAGSPSIDAGDPALLDADGSPADVGAYAGPYGSWM